MNDVNFFSPFLTAIQTTKDANDTLEQISTIMNLIYKNDQRNLKQLFSETFRIDLFQALLPILEQNNIIQGNTSVAKDFLDRLESAVKTCEVFSLTIAIQPTQKVITDLAGYIKQTFGKNTIIELTIDPSLIAGAVVVFKGRYTDMSVKTKLTHYFTQ